MTTATCPECEGSPDLPPGERCYLCNTKSKRVDDPASGAATVPLATGKSSTGAKSTGAARKPRSTKAPAKKKKRRHGRTAPYPKWAKAIAQPVFGIVTGGCVIHIASLLIGS